MIRSYLPMFILALVVSSASAQQDPQFTQWYMDHTMSNIAAAGHSDLTQVNGFYRNQWVGLDRRPVTSLLNVNGKVGMIPGAYGLQFYQDELGHESNTMLKLGYAYTLSPFSGGTTLSLGASVSYFSKKLGADWISIDPWQDDIAIPQDGTTSSAVDLDLGIYLEKSKTYYAGFSMTHLAETQLSDMSITPARHFYIMGGYNYAIDGDLLVLRTNMLAKTDLNATAIDFNANVIYDDMIWGGISWRPGDAIAPILGFQYRMINKDPTSYNEQLFRIGYSFDATTSELQTYSSGSHEIFLSYSFKFESTPIQNKYANPRFL